MGQGQSNPRDDVDVVREIKVSYYELLGVERRASEDELKKAYRRKALELHPDRNYGDVERTTKLFAEIQTAYEVLSDPQERAWYDSHESDILSGNDGQDVSGNDGQYYEQNIGHTSADEIARMMKRFHGNVEFTDAPSGFYGFLRDKFAQLAKEEEVAARREDLDVVDYPSFGHKDDTYDDVVKAFYSVWNGFATKKTFAWRDRFRLSEASDRTERRLMEKFNKRLRDEGIREFNAAVRSLILFVRKRDPRYLPNTQSEAERQQALRDAVAAQKTRSRMQNAAKLGDVAVPDWAKARNPDEEEELEETESEEEHFECVACRKVFKSENQFEAHERSKKHIKAVQALRKRLKKEGHALDLDEELVEDEDRGIAGSDDWTTVEKGSENEAESSPDALINERMKTISVEKHEIKPENNVNIVHGEDQDVPEVDDDVETDHSDDDNPETLSDLETAQTSPKHVPKQKQGKAAQKRARKAAASQQASNENANTHSCAKCGASFPSRTRMFQHINDLKHGAPIVKAATTKR